MTSAIGGVLLFVAGLAVGGGVVLYGCHTTDKALEAYRRENERLKESAWQDRLTYECDRAWDEGYQKGRKHPIHAIEELANTLEQHGSNVKFNRKAVQQVK